MKIISKRVIENILLILFPAALFIGCAGTGEEKPKIFGAAEMVPWSSQESLAQVPYAFDTDVMTAPERVGQTVGMSEITPVPVVLRTSVPYTEPASAVTSDESRLKSTQLVEVIFFATDKFDVDAVRETQLAAHAKLLKDNPGLRLIINGHADERGTKQHNLRLSELRAKAVEGLLLSLGVNENQLLINCFGASIPTQDISHWNENRRVELQYSHTTLSQAW